MIYGKFLWRCWIAEGKQANVALSAVSVSVVNLSTSGPDEQTLVGHPPSTVETHQRLWKS